MFGHGLRRCYQTNSNQSLVRSVVTGHSRTLMTRISYKRHRFPAAIIQHAIWLYLRFTLSFRDVEEMIARRGVDVGYDGPRLACVVRFEARG